MKNPVLTERKTNDKPELKYAVEEVLVLLSFALEGMKSLNSNYRTTSVIMVDKRMLFIDLISRHPSIECAKKEIEVVKTWIMNFMKDHFGSGYSIPMEVVDQEKNGIHTLTEKLTGESIHYTDCESTALLSIYDLLKKACAKIQFNIETFGPDSFYNSSANMNRLVCDLSVYKIITAKILIKSLTYNIN